MALELNRYYMKYFYDPVAESFEEGFWNAVKQRKLVFQRCSECGEWLHPPRPMCHKCRSFDLEWVESTGGHFREQNDLFWLRTQVFF